MPEFLTPAGRSKIENDLDVLKDKRPQIAKRIRNAKEMGDLSENTEYTAAKDDQSWVESQINNLENLLKSAEIIDTKKNSDKVIIGSKVTVKIGMEIKIFTIVGSIETDPSNGLISHQSPLGEALLDRSVNEQAKVQMPNGLLKLKVINIE
ncbi:transcription elongation factor GreA [Patescibacteria group bacterium]|nr:transcription elongation factor GreA [Patescibacteria group bacterium]